MVKKIIFAGIFVCLLIAIPLAMLGYKQVELGTPFLALMKAVNNDLEGFKIEIPNIPNIPRISPLDNSEDNNFLVVLINIGNAIITFFNTVINIINIIVQIFNIVIQLLQVIFLLVKHLITFKDTIAQYNSTPIIALLIS